MKRRLLTSFQNNYNLEVALIWPPLLTDKGYNLNLYSNVNDMIVHGTEEEVTKTSTRREKERL